VSALHASRKTGETKVEWTVRLAKASSDQPSLCRRLFSLRRRHPALIEGDISNVLVGGDPLVACLRRTRDNEIVVAINFRQQKAHATLQLPGRGELTTLLGGPKRRTRVPAPGRVGLGVPATAGWALKYTYKAAGR